MSSMPERDMPQSDGRTEQSARIDERGTPSQGGAPAQEQLGAVPAGSIPGQPGGGQPGGGQSAGEGPGQHGGQPAGQEVGQPGAQQGGWAGQAALTPVSEAQTRVTWRRIFQYWIDAFFVSVIPYLVSIPFDRSASTIMNIIGGVVYVVLFVLIGLGYWVIWPHSHNGQTFAMKWFGVRVISKDGEPASLLQLFVRWISLLFDSAPWMWPFTGLLGLIVMLCSRRRQRIGDHLAKTLVIRTAGRRPGDAGGPGDYGQAGMAQSGAVQSGTVQSGTVQSGTVQSGTVQSGTVQSGTLQSGTLPSGTVQHGPDAGEERAAGQEAHAARQPDADQADVAERSGRADMDQPRGNQQ
jgi:uncharacterized RDD family membrane protein YckC